MFSHNITPTHIPNSITESNPINMNHQIRDDEWKKFEESIGSQGSEVANCLAKYVLEKVKGVGDCVSEQIFIPSTFPEGFDEYRKIQSNKKTNTKGFSELYGITPDYDLNISSDSSENSKKKKLIN